MLCREALSPRPSDNTVYIKKSNTEFNLRERALFLREQDGAVLNTPFRSASKFRSIMKKGRRKSAPPPKNYISHRYITSSRITKRSRTSAGNPVIGKPQGGPPDNYRKRGARNLQNLSGSQPSGDSQRRSQSEPQLHRSTAVADSLYNIIFHNAILFWIIFEFF